MFSGAKLQLLLGYQAVLYAYGLLFLCGAIWGLAGLLFTLFHPALLALAKK